MTTVDAFIRYADGSIEPLQVVAIPERRLFTLPEAELPPPPAVACDICGRPAVWWDEWSQYCRQHKPKEVQSKPCGHCGRPMPVADPMGYCYDCDLEMGV